MALTLEDLRRELKMFAEDTMRKEMKALVTDMMQDLRNTESPASSNSSADYEAPALPVTQMAVEAVHCAPDSSYTELQQDAVGTQARTLSAESKEERPVKPSRLKAWANDVVHSTVFEIFSASLVLLNSLWIGIATDWIARNWTSEVPGSFHIIDDLFCVVAVLELMLRLIAAGADFYHGAHSGWHMFDTVVVSTQVVDMVLTHLASHQGGGKDKEQHAQGATMSLFRIFKLARILRIARVASTFPELHVLIRSIADSFANLFWTMVLVFSFNYAAAILITHLVSEYKIEKGREEILQNNEEMEDLYGNIMRTIVSLFMIISGGISWIDLMHPLAQNISPLFRYFFVPLTGFQIFGMMNVITACFVDNALRIAAATDLKHMLDSLWIMFGGVQGGGDEGMADSNLEVSVRDFENHFSKPEMKKFLDMIHAKQGINASQVFALMDKDGDGSLSIHEFVACCDHIIGPAKGSALAAFAKDHASFAKEQRKMIQGISETQQAQYDEMMKHMSTLGAAIKNGNGTTPN